jgi:nicotinamide-nucleotide amidase
MKAEVIAIGSELLLGQIIDTNSSYIAKRLAENGIELVQTATVGDDLQRMEEVIREAINRSQIVITTGGIGPTEDDLTREAIAEVTQHPLTFQPYLMEQIETLFKKRGFRMSESNQKQAYIPEGAIPQRNSSRIYCRNPRRGHHFHPRRSFRNGIFNGEYRHPLSSETI